MVDRRQLPIFSASTFSALPTTGNRDGDVFLTRDTLILYAWSSATSSWKNANTGADYGNFFSFRKVDDGGAYGVVTYATAGVTTANGGGQTAWGSCNKIKSMPFPMPMPKVIKSIGVNVTTAVAGSYTSFAVSGANATAAATYTDGTTTFTVALTIAAGSILVCSSTAAPVSGSGTLTKVTGTGDATIAYTSQVTSTAKCRLAVYKDSGNLVPQTLVVDLGEVDCSTTGFKQVSGLSLSLPPGALYWMSLITSAPGIGFTTITPANGQPGILGFALSYSGAYTAYTVDPLMYGPFASTYVTANGTLSGGGFPVIMVAFSS